MIPIEKNLEHLVNQYEICDKQLIDEYSLKIRLGKSYYKPDPEKFGKVITYNVGPEPKTLFMERANAEQNLSLEPGECLIASSQHKYKIPHDYFGLVQTKGTLARLFVQATCNDGQIEPGFDGYITLEIVNLSKWKIQIPIGSDVAQLYLVKCSSPADRAYSGRYSEECKNGPTLAIFRE
ncbi:dCTP deaminase [Deefgea rivuli]|uniref:dCTP deaminase n=1 Tax=Deefgea rivuli TaxID=400948 RepID=UPI00048319EF|nr:deoxycytidine deaminase [Deefgea rivuli]